MGRRAVVRVQGPDGRAMRYGPAVRRVVRDLGRRRRRRGAAAPERARRSPTARRSRCRRCSPCTPSRCSAKRSCERYGRRFPLLPKLLDVAELLSVQAHPPGNTEVYVIVDADPGATIRLGFAADVDAGTLGREASRRPARSAALARAVRRGAGGRAASRAQAVARAARCGAGGARSRAAAAAGRRRPLGRRRGAARDVARRLLGGARLVECGPRQSRRRHLQREPARGWRPRAANRISAEVHALGNPEGRGVFALEIRRPGPTFRAWDNVRFPLRDIDIDATLEALNLTATRPAEFMVEPKRVRPGVRRSVDWSTSGSSISSRRRCWPSTCRRRRRTRCTRSRAASTSCEPTARSWARSSAASRRSCPWRRRVPARRRRCAGRARQSGLCRRMSTERATERPTDSPRPATLRIDLDALARNFRLLRDRAAPADCAAVVKADAYGLGVERVVRRLLREGCRGSSSRPLAEARELRALARERRDRRIRGRAREHGRRARRARCAARAEHARAGRALARQGPRAAAPRYRHEPARLRVPTWLRSRAHRIVLDDARARFRHDASRVRRRARASHERRAARALRAHAPVVAVGRHLDRQLGRHAASMPRIAAISCGPASRCTAATRSAIGRTQWRASSTLTAPILQLREIGEPQTVGYGATYVANPPARLAVVGIGYADGYPRSLGNAGRRPSTAGAFPSSAGCRWT